MSYYENATATAREATYPGRVTGTVGITVTMRAFATTSVNTYTYYASSFKPGNTKRFLWNKALAQKFELLGKKLSTVGSKEPIL